MHIVRLVGISFGIETTMIVQNNVSQFSTSPQNVLCDFIIAVLSNFER